MQANSPNQEILNNLLVEETSYYKNILSKTITRNLRPQFYGTYFIKIGETNSYSLASIQIHSLVLRAKIITQNSMEELKQNRFTFGDLARSKSDLVTDMLQQDNSEDLFKDKMELFLPLCDVQYVKDVYSTTKTQKEESLINLDSFRNE